jgi:mono/diheme cytochrome c family protein
MAREPVSLVDPVWKTGIARAKIAEIVRHGTGKMEGLGDKLSDAEIDAVAGYVVWLPAPHDTRAAR